jgi:hypothetical protein
VNLLAHTLSELKTRGQVLLREAKGVLSSELEGVIVKATRPSGAVIKQKHLEVLLAISYQSPIQLDPYPAILRFEASSLRTADGDGKAYHDVQQEALGQNDRGRLEDFIESSLCAAPLRSQWCIRARAQSQGTVSCVTMYSLPELPG